LPDPFQARPGGSDTVGPLFLDKRRGARQVAGMEPRRLALVPLLMLAVPAVHAQTIPTPAPISAAPLPDNTVSCVYDYMSAEDRELALLLIAREIVDGGRFSKGSKNVQAVDRLIEDAHELCLNRFNWSIGRSNAAMGYALTAILAEALSQALDSFGHPSSPVAEYYRENRAALAGKIDLNRTDQDKLAAYLKLKGWEKAAEAELALAGLYLETFLLKENAQRDFSRAGGTSRRPLSRPRPQSSKAKRGRP
jgi:hypothetical protein